MYAHVSTVSPPARCTATVPAVANSSGSVDTREECRASRMQQFTGQVFEMKAAEAAVCENCSSRGCATASGGRPAHRQLAVGRHSWLVTAPA